MVIKANEAAIAAGQGPHQLQAEMLQIESMSGEQAMAAENCLTSLQSQMSPVMGEMTSGGSVLADVVASVRSQMESLFSHLQSI